MEDQNKLENFFGIDFDDNSRNTMQTIALWAKICSICAFIGYGVALVVAFMGKTRTQASFGDETTTVNSFAKGSAIAGAFIAAIIGTAINYFLYKFATDAKEGLTNIDQLKLNDGFRNLKTYFKILGIILLICLIFVGLAILIGMFASIGRR